MATSVANPVHTTVVGAFDQAPDAHAAVEDLRRAGFDDTHIGYITPGAPSEHVIDGVQPEESAKVGAALGAAIGSTAGLIAAAAMLSPIGAATVGGALVALVVSLGVGVATGTVFGALVDIGVSEDDARWYESEVKAGRSLVIVQNADQRAEEAREIIRYDHGMVREPSPIGVYGTGMPATPF